MSAFHSGAGELNPKSSRARLARPLRPRQRAETCLRAALVAASVLGALVASPLVAKAQTDDPCLTALVRALDRRMTVWRSPGGERVQYVGHCRSARGGCR